MSIIFYFEIEYSLNIYSMWYQVLYLCNLYFFSILSFQIAIKHYFKCALVYNVCVLAKRLIERERERERMGEIEKGGESEFFLSYPQAGFLFP